MTGKIAKSSLSLMDLLGPDLSKARYWTEFDEHGERLVMPLRRSWKVIGFALVGLGFLAIQHARDFASNPGLFEWAWGIVLLIVLLHVLLNILTSLLAREVVQVKDRELIHGWRLLGLKRERRYPLAAIRSLSAERETKLPDEEQLLSPLKDFGKVGVVNFDCGAQTIGIGAALDQDHGRQVVIWIARRAPRHVTDRFSA